MLKIFQWSFIFVLISGVALVSGCGKKSISKSQADLAFENAPVEIKDTWGKATAADISNDYVTATIEYTHLLSAEVKTNLSETQITAVTQLYVALSRRMSSAAAKGDPAAIQASRTLIEIGRKRQ